MDYPTNNAVLEAREKKNIELRETFTSLTIAARTFNATLFALAGAVLAGIVQLAGHADIANASNWPIFSATAALISATIGTTFLAVTWQVAKTRYNHRFPKAEASMSEDAIAKSNQWETRSEWILGAQFLTWLLSGVGYAVSLLTVLQ